MAGAPFAPMRSRRDLPLPQAAAPTAPAAGRKPHMAEIELTPKHRQQLKGAAHRLDPVVLLGERGLTDAVVREIDRALTAHELIKVRAPGTDRAAREDMFREVAARLGAARVQMIGKLLVLFRPRPDKAADAQSAPPTRRTPIPKSPAATAPTKADRARRAAPARRPRQKPGAARRR
jgi:RNA-binding protein